MQTVIDNIANWVFYHTWLTVIYMASCFICHLVIDYVCKKRPDIPMGSKVLLRIMQFVPVINTLYSIAVIIAFTIGFSRR